MTKNMKTELQFTNNLASWPVPIHIINMVVRPTECIKEITDETVIIYCCQSNSEESSSLTVGRRQWWKWGFTRVHAPCT